MFDFINGNKFLDIADFAIDFDHKNINTNIYAKNAIIYCKTDFINQLFDFIKFSKRQYILITHMSDYPIDERRFKSAPSSIVKWFAENAVYDHPNLISIPLGLENHVGSSKGKFTNHQWLSNNIEDLFNNEKDDTIYCNWNNNTNQEIRIPIIEQLKQNQIQFVLESGLSYETYCTNMSQHKFILCPPGNGIDTHRLWEALYLGCIPITLKHRIYNEYKLPILQVNNWSEVTWDNLDMFFKQWCNKWPFEQLNMQYWINLIKKEYESL